MTLPFDILIQILELCDFPELIKSQFVCKSFYQCINQNPKLFWFKYPIKIYNHSYNCRGCVIKDILCNFYRKDLVIEYERICPGFEVFEDHMILFW